MESLIPLILNLLLAAICLWHIAVSYFSKDKTKIWSPITFFSLTYLYYCVIPMFETDGIFMGVSSAPYAGLFHFAALLSFLSILWGFYVLKISLKSDKTKWNSCITDKNYKKIAVVLVIFALICYIPSRGFSLNLFVSESNLTEYDWENQGLNFYFVSTISVFVASCCLLITRIKENKMLFAIIFWITFVTYIIGGFRYRLIILVIAIFTSYYLYDKTRKIKIVPLVIVGLVCVFVFNIMDITRSYSNGIVIEAVQDLDDEDLIRKAGETEHVYNFSAIVIGRYQESGRLDLFDPIVNAILFPIPRILFPWKPMAEYAFEGSNFAMKGNPGSAYLGFVEAFMAFSWLGVIINGLFVGWLARRFWNYYQKYPNSVTAIIALSIFNGFTYVIVSRGYLAQQLTIFTYFIYLPLFMARIINKFLKYG